MAGLTNSDFADAVGCSESMASRLRSGRRRPSAELRDRIVLVYKLDPMQAIQAYSDADTFGSFLRQHIFESNGR
jgi:transcriptional regulator with XRE-family HTH domain